MQSINDSSFSLSENSDKITNPLGIWVLLSWVDNIISIHTTIKKFANDQDWGLYSEGLNFKEKGITHNVIDVSLITKWKNIIEVKEQSINCILNKIEGDQIKLSKDVGEDLYQEIVDFSILKPNDDPFLLKK